MEKWGIDVFSSILDVYTIIIECQFKMNAV